jgi:hypothetical protein
MAGVVVQSVRAMYNKRDEVPITLSASGIDVLLIPSCDLRVSGVCETDRCEEVY